MKSQSTSKAGEMEWEKRFDEDIAPYITDYGGISEDPVLEDMIKNFIRTTINQAIAHERERIYNILMAKQELVVYQKDNGHGVAVPCSDIMNIITNNHE